jgi:maltose/moltooligosaccharide transporter
MEPFRAFVGDQLPTPQRAKGYAMQSFFIGIGAVVASVLPYVLARLGVSNIAPADAIPDTVRYSFYAGGAVLCGSVLWTVLTTREYPPEQLLAFEDDTQVAPPVQASRAWRFGLLLAGLGDPALVAGPRPLFTGRDAGRRRLAVRLAVLHAWPRHVAPCDD